MWIIYGWQADSDEMLRRKVDNIALCFKQGLLFYLQRAA